MVILRLLVVILLSVNCFGSKITDTVYWIGTPTSIGVGFANTAKTNSSDSIYYNPAGLGTLSESSINIAYTSFYETNFTNINFIARNKTISFGVGLQLNNSNNIDETAYDETTNSIITTGSYDYSYTSIFFSAAMQMPFISFAKVGSSLHIHRMNIGSDTLMGQSANIGLHMKPFNFFSLGLNYYNLLPLKLNWRNPNAIDGKQIETTHLIDSYIIAGIEVIPYQTDDIKWRILADFEIESEQNTTESNTEYSPLKLGTELKWSFLIMRAGYNYRNTSIGVSTRLSNFQINYTFIMPSNSEYFDNRNSVGINFYM